MQFIRAFALLLLAPLTAAGQAPAAAKPSISTTGEATVYVTPDEVSISLGSEVFHAVLSQAKSQLDERTETLLKAVKEAGVEGKDIQTDDVQVEVIYSTDNDQYQVTGYKARRSYVVKIKDVKKVSAVVDAALLHGANRLYGVDYATTELRRHRDDARKMAIKAAKEKAQLLAGELDMAVGSPTQISEASGWFGYNGAWGRGNSMMMQNSASHADAGDGGDGNMPLGQIAVRASVSVTFEMSRRN